MLRKRSPQPSEGMTARERVLTALAYREPDQVPIDFGSTWITTIHADAYERLKHHFAIDSPTIIMERMQQVREQASGYEDYTANGKE